MPGKKRTVSVCPGKNPRPGFIEMPNFIPPFMSKTNLISFFIFLAVCVAGYYYYRANQKSSYHYYGYYDRIKGLQKSDPVLLNGVKIGKVTSVELHTREKIKVGFSIKKTFPIPEGSKAIIGNSTLSGSIQVRLEPGSSSRILPDGSELFTGTDTSIMEMFHEKISPVLNNAAFLLGIADSALIEFNHLITTGLAHRTREEIQQISTTLHQTSATSGDMLQQSPQWISLIRRIDSMTAEPLRMNSNINRSIDSVGTATHELNKIPFRKRADSLLLVLGQAGQQLQKTEEGLLSPSSRQQLSSIGKKLDTLRESLSALQEHPPGFSIFGKKKKK